MEGGTGRSGGSLGNTYPALPFVLSWLPCGGVRPSEKMSCLNFKLGTSLLSSLPFPERIVSANSPRVLTPGGVILRISSQDPTPTIHSLKFFQAPQFQVSLCAGDMACISSHIFLPLWFKLQTL